jgi:DNA-directed RNA polymerase sigma subunit (sigma70/sigma32)
VVRRGPDHEGRTIRIPVHLLELRRQYEDALRQLEERFNREPTDEGVAKMMGCPKGRVAGVQHMQRIRSAWLKPREKEAELAQPAASNSADALDLCVWGEEFDRLKRALGHLTPREREVIKRHFGLPHGRTETFQAIAQRLGVTHERLRQTS